MNKKTESILKKINEKIGNSSYIYFSREIERSTGLEDTLKNFSAVCIEPHYIVSELRKKGHEIFALEEQEKKLIKKTTLDLVSNPETLSWIKNKTKGNEFYCQFFQFSDPAIKAIEEVGGIVLNNSARLNRFFEDKLNQYKLLVKHKIPVPEGDIVSIDMQSYQELATKFGRKFVVQLDRAHTGGGTFFVENAEAWESLQKNIRGNQVKITEFIDAQAYTINGCVAGGKIFTAGLQYQITGVKGLTSGIGTTVGNDWCAANEVSNKTKEEIRHTVNKIGLILKESGFRGMFGIDLLIDSSEQIYVLEINARQTANIPMQTKLEMEADHMPLALLHLAEFLEIDISGIDPYPDLLPLKGSQIFLRSKDEYFTVNNDVKNGVYRLQSDNSAIDWQRVERKENVIFADEDMDKPLIWQNDGYSVNEIFSGGFVLLTQSAGTVRYKNEELARMQFKNQIIFNNKPAGWITEALVEIERMMR